MHCGETSRSIYTFCTLVQPEMHKTFQSFVVTFELKKTLKPSVTKSTTSLNLPLEHCNQH